MTSTLHNPYALTGPCARCPFRTDNVGVVRAERAAEIANEVRNGGGEFVCHKTTVAHEDDETEFVEMRPGPKALVCGGWLATMEAGGEANQMMRVAERLGMYHPEKIDTSAVFEDGLTAWVRAHQEDNGLVHCEVVGDDCQDPPGYGGGGGVYENPEPGTCDEDNDCSLCGRVMCSDCTGEPDEDGLPPVCVTCIEGEDWE